MKTVVKACLFLLKKTKCGKNTNNKRGIKFHSKPIYEQKYLKSKVREFDGVIKTNILGNKVPKENMHYTCIAFITIDSVMKINKKNHLQVYLEECK